MLVPTLMKFHLLPLRKPHYVAIGEAQFYQAVEAWKTYSASGKEQPALREMNPPPKSPTTGDVLPSLKKNNGEPITQLKPLEALGRCCFFGSKKREPTCVENNASPKSFDVHSWHTCQYKCKDCCANPQSIDIRKYTYICIYISLLYTRIIYFFTSANTQRSRQNELVKIDKQQSWILGPGIWRRHPTTLKSQGHRGVQPNTTIFYLRQWPGLG